MSYARLISTPKSTQLIKRGQYHYIAFSIIYLHYQIFLIMLAIGKIIKNRQLTDLTPQTTSVSVQILVTSSIWDHHFPLLSLHIRYSINSQRKSQLASKEALQSKFGTKKSDGSFCFFESPSNEPNLVKYKISNLYIPRLRILN